MRKWAAVQIRRLKKRKEKNDDDRGLEQQRKNEKCKHHEIIHIGTRSDDVEGWRDRKRDNTNETEEGNSHRKRKKKCSEEYLRQSDRQRRGERVRKKKQKEERQMIS